MKQQQILFESPVSEVAKDCMLWYDRATVLSDEYGFLPTTIFEVNTAFSGIIAFDNSPAGVGSHLQEVLINQKKNHLVESPNKAVRSIVRNMGVLYYDATNRRNALREVYDTLGEGINPELKLVDIIDQESLNLQGILSAIQYFAVRKAVELRDRDPLRGGIKRTPTGKRLVTAYDQETHDRTTIEMLFGTLPAEIHTAGKFRNIILQAGKSHRLRRSFWQGALNSSRSHMIARPVVDAILDTEK